MILTLKVYTHQIFSKMKLSCFYFLTILKVAQTLVDVGGFTVCLVLTGGGSCIETRLSSPTSNLGWFCTSLILDAIEVFLDPAMDLLGDFTLPAADGGLDPV